MSGINSSRVILSKHRALEAGNHAGRIVGKLT